MDSGSVHPSQVGWGGHLPESVKSLRNIYDSEGVHPSQLGWVGHLPESMKSIRNNGDSEGAHPSQVGWGGHPMCPPQPSAIPLAKL